MCIDADRALWRAVLLQMIQDIKTNSKKANDQIAKRRALHWLGTQSFNTVCDYADYDPSYVMSMIKLSESREFQWRLPTGRGWRIQGRIAKELGGSVSRTLIESQHLDGVKSLGCLTCLEMGFETPALPHYCGTKMSCPKDDMQTAPLCPEHHTGAKGIHKAGKQRRVLEQRYLAYVKEHCPCPSCKRGRA